MTGREPVRWYDPAEIADLLGLSPQMIYKLIDSGEMGAAQFGRSIRVSQDDLDAYVEEGRRRLREKLAERQARRQGTDHPDAEADTEPAPEPATPTRRKADARK